MALEAAPIQIQQTQIFGSSTCEPSCSLKCSPLNDACLSETSERTSFPKVADIGYNDKSKALIQPGSGDSDKKSEPPSSIQIHSGVSSATDHGNAKIPARYVSRKSTRKNGKMERKPVGAVISKHKKGVSCGGKVDHKAINCANDTENVASSSVSYKHPEESFLDIKVCDYDGLSKPVSTENFGLTESNCIGDSTILNQAETPMSCPGENAGCHPKNVNSNEADTKEKSHLKWNKRRKAFGRSGTYKEKNANHNHMNSDAGLLRTNHCGKPEPFVGCESLAASLKSYSELSDIAPGTESCSGNSCDLVEQNQCPSQSSQTDASSEQMSNSQVILTPSWRRKRNNSRKRKVQGHGIGLNRPQDGLIPSQNEQLQQNLPHAKNFTGKGSTFSNAVHPHIWMQIPRAMCGTLHTSADGEQKIQSFVDPRVSHRLLPYRKSFLYRTCSKKWIPVCRKEAKMTEITASPNTEDKNVDNPKLYYKHEDCSQLDCSISSPPIPVSSNSENTISVMKESPGMNSESYNVLSPCIDDNRNETVIKELHGASNKHLSGVSPSSEEAFNSSYRLQLASEFVHQAMGYPLAEFEQLLYLATPTIVSSLMCQTCDNCSVEHQCGASRYWMPSISLGAIWKWYEELGNYGLKVSFEDQDKNGSLSNQVSFHAHFVPFLSAIQLFGLHHLPASFAKSNKIPVNDRVEAPLHLSAFESLVLTSSKESTTHSLEDETLNSKENCAASKEPLDLPCTRVCHKRCSLPTFLGDAELLFEFFESEQPHLRMPLYNKVMELSNAGVSNNQRFGDPSILNATELNDLHPSSWFSVAWYPIYRIPEGKLRAAFLTYHSLGYVVHRNAADDLLDKNKSCVSFPVIGLQSYNAQDKIWFSSKVEVSSVLKELASLLLKERRWALEQNASAFARGLVRKGNMNKPNRHPDFEYFISHKY